MDHEQSAVGAVAGEGTGRGAGAVSGPFSGLGSGAAWVRWSAVVLGFAALLAVASWLAAGLHISPIAAYVVGFTVVSASSIAAGFASPRFSGRALVLLLAPACTLAALALYAQGVGLTEALAVTVALLLGCSLLGTVIGGAIEHPGQIIFVAIVSSAADVFSVFHPSGPTAAIAQSEVALSVVALPWPMLGSPNIEPFLGAGDVVFAALYAGCARRHDLALGRTALALSLGFGLAMFAVVVLEQALPALPFLGLMMVVLEPACRRPPERDRVRGYAIACGMVGVVAWLLLGR